VLRSRFHAKRGGELRNDQKSRGEEFTSHSEPQEGVSAKLGERRGTIACKCGPTPLLREGEMRKNMEIKQTREKQVGERNQGGE